MKKNIILIISFLLISINLLSGCSNNNNPTNSKIIVSLMDFKDGNLIGPKFKDVSAPPNGSKFVYVELKVTNKMDKEIKTNPYYITLIDNENKSYLYFKASFDLVNCYVKENITPGGYFRGGLIYVILITSIPTKLQYFDPLNDINITIPIKL